MKVNLVLQTPDGKIELPKRAQFLNKSMTSNIFALRWQEGKKPAFQSRFMELCKAAADKGGWDPDFIVILDLDHFTNTISIAPPLLSPDYNRVIFDPKEYDKARNHDRWPIEIVDLVEMSSLSMLYPNKPSKIVKAAEGKRIVSPIGNSGKK